MAARNPRAPVRFSWNGRFASALPGETVAQALLRDGSRPLTRSIRYHRPRGPFCGSGQCTGCLVTVDGWPNVRACQTVPRAGASIRGQNAWPSVQHDLLALLDRLFPKHLDTLHGFRRPAFLTPVYQRVVRRLAGYGRLPSAPVPPEAFPPRLRWETDLLVVGGGRSGSRIADAVARAVPTASVLLVDRRKDGPPLPGEPPRNLRVHRGASLVFLPPPGPGGFQGLLSLDSGGTVDVLAPRVVLAPGSYDASLVFAGNDRPGVLTGDGALALSFPGGTMPFHQAVLVGAGDRARDLLGHFGPRVSHVVSLLPLEPAERQDLEARGPRVLDARLVLRAIGGKRLRGLEVRDRRTGSVERLPADVVILAARRLPNVPLFFQAGVAMHWRAGSGAYYPVLSPSGATSVPGLYAAGAAAGYERADPSRALRDRLVETLRCEMTGQAPPQWEDPVPGRVPEEGRHPLVPYYHEWLRSGVGGKALLCPCEDVVVEELDEAVHEGFRGIEEIKRVTGAGTGLCQGRYCLPETLLLLSLFQGVPPPELGFITQRPPVWPTSVGGLAAPAPGPPALGAEEGTVP